MKTDLKSLEQHRRDIIYSRKAVSMALKKGELTKEPCMCGETKVEGHHPDYKKPLEVVWMCKRHHTELHKEQREMHVMD